MAPPYKGPGSHKPGTDVGVGEYQGVANLGGTLGVERNPPVDWVTAPLSSAPILTCWPHLIASACRYALFAACMCVNLHIDSMDLGSQCIC